MHSSLLAIIFHISRPRKFLLLDYDTAGLREEIDVGAMVFGCFLCSSRRALEKCCSICWVIRHGELCRHDFLQLFLWERFEALFPIPLEFKPVKPRIVKGVEKTKSPLLMSQGLRWYGATWLEAPGNPLALFFMMKEAITSVPTNILLEGSCWTNFMLS